MGRGTESAHFLVFRREQASECPVAQASTRPAGHGGEHVEVVHQGAALVLGDRPDGLPGLQEEQRRREDALADGGQVG
jgi:hypothetical protein